jgi:hypothetical protein
MESFTPKIEASTTIKVAHYPPSATVDNPPSQAHTWQFTRGCQHALSSYGGGRRGDYRVLCNLLLRRGVAFRSFGIAGPCVLGKPLVRHTAERTMGPAEEHWAGPEGDALPLAESGTGHLRREDKRTVTIHGLC